MKSIKLLMATAVAALAINAQAQLVKKTEGYDRASVSFVAANHYTDDADAKTKGAAVAYTKGINLTQKLPLFLELGGELVFTHGNEDYHVASIKYEEKSTYMNLAIPVNVAYKLSFASNNISISPLAGFNFKVNLLGKSKNEVDGKESSNVSHFDSDEVGDDTANRFQLGMNLGVNVDLGSFYVGWRFQQDLMKYWEIGKDYKVKSHANMISVGLYF